MAIVQNLDSFTKKSGQIVYWLTDSKCNYSFLKFGSRKPYIQKIILQIKLFELRYDFCIIPIWAPRTNALIAMADAGSKFSTSTDEWSIDRISFENICSKFGTWPTVDAFASSENRRCSKFFSKIPQIGSMGTNFFAQHLSPEEVYFCCPPPKLIIYALKHFFSFRNCTGVFICPLWKSANYFTFIVHGQRMAPFVLDYFIFNPRFTSKQGVFKGYKNFNMIAILVKSGTNTGGLKFSPACHAQP